MSNKTLALKDYNYLLPLAISLFVEGKAINARLIVHPLNFTFLAEFPLTYSKHTIQQLL